MYGQRIRVGFEVVAAVKDRGTFSCTRCRHWQRAEVVDTGRGLETYLGADGTAASRARARDVQRTLRFATCPRCKHRSGYRAFVAPYLLASFAAIAGAVLFAFVVAHVKQGQEGAEEFRLYFPLLVAALTAIIAPYALLDRWKHNDDRIRWLDF